MTTVGIIGAGQLGQMLGQAGNKLGVECIYLDPAPLPPAASVGRVIAKSFDDEEGLLELSNASDVLTYEFENVPVTALAAIPDDVAVFPPASALEFSQDRLTEKSLFDELQIPLPAYRAVDSEQDLRDAAAEIGLPLVLKTRRLGYDGKGQLVVRDESDIPDAISQLGHMGLVAEQLIKFECEVSAIGARSQDGNMVFYPLTENRHEAGILSTSCAPYSSPTHELTAQKFLQRLFERLDYVGVLALELFVTEKGLLANEFAPRVHNSGHWTIEGTTTSQFENHLRAVCGLPLGDTKVCGYAGMINLIAHMPTDIAAISANGGFLHDYGKESRPGRKLGHITVVTDSADSRNQRMDAVQAALEGC